MSWAQFLHDYMTNPSDESASWSGQTKNYAVAAAVVGKDFSSDANADFWAASAGTEMDSDAAWARVYAAPQERMLAQDDGTEKGVQIDEMKSIVDAIKTGGKPVWIGGVKNQFTKRDVLADENMIAVLVSKPGQKGYWIIYTDAELKGKGAIVVAEWDKPGGCEASMAYKVAMDFAKWLVEGGQDKAW